MIARRLPIFFLLVLSVSVAGCETGISAYSPSTTYFSLFGLLDAEDQTHWVRVEALQDGRTYGADSTLKATVTLTHLATGREVTMTDSLFSFRDRGEVYFAHNFYAKMDLELDETYRLTVRGADSETSTTTLTMPREIPEVSVSEVGTSATVEGGTEDRLLFLNAIYHTVVMPGEPTGKSCEVDAVRAPYEVTFEGQYAGQALRTEAGYHVVLSWKQDVRAAYRGPEAVVSLRRVAVEVALVDADAPDYGGRSYEELFDIGGAPSNVEHGVGYVAGVARDTASVTITPPPSGTYPCVFVP